MPQLTCQSPCGTTQLAVFCETGSHRCPVTVNQFPSQALHQQHAVPVRALIDLCLAVVHTRVSCSCAFLRLQAGRVPQGAEKLGHGAAGQPVRAAVGQPREERGGQVDAGGVSSTPPSARCRPASFCRDRWWRFSRWRREWQSCHRRCYSPWCYKQSYGKHRDGRWRCE